MTDKDKARMKAVGADTEGIFGSNSPELYSEEKLRGEIYNDNVDKREKAYVRNEAARQTMRQQKRQGDAMNKFGDNSFKPFTTTAPTLSKQIMAANAKKKR
jgi:hypothetical protein